MVPFCYDDSATLYVCLSVCLFVRLSVAFMSCIKTAEHIKVS